MLKTVSSITNSIGALNYKGTWDANANSPALTSSVGTKGDYYVVGTAGSTNLNGISNWGVGDWAAYNGSVWQRVEGGADLNGVNLSVSGTSTLSGLTASTALALDASKNVVSVSNTGTGNNVLATSPTLVTPALGAATATSINKVALTAPVTGSTLTIADGKTLTANHSLTLAGTDATTMTFPTTSATIARTDAAQTFTGNQTFSDDVTANVFHGQTKTFVNLSTTYVDVYTGNTAFSATYLVRMNSVDGCACTFLLALSFQSGLGIITTTTNLSGCVGGNNPGTILMAPDDARTYTFVRDGGTGNLQIKASSLATGTTTLRIVQLF
jgi:hypothetical protein